MTAAVQRLPLHDLSMSSLQSGSRRHSARLQQKDESTAVPNDGNIQIEGQPATVKSKTVASTKSKKRKTELQEEDDGFVFTRAKKKQRQVGEPLSVQAPNLSTIPEASKEVPRGAEPVVNGAVGAVESSTIDSQPPKKKPRRMTFLTPVKAPTRRSKRISTALETDQENPTSKVPPELRPTKTRKEKIEKPRPPAKKSKELTPPPSEERDAPVLQQEKPVKASKIPRKAPEPAPEPESVDVHEENHSPTKIALPFADTPVITRNKAMRENKSGKKERRSSLGLRGRRASSLIDSGQSTALPHAEVDIKEFYKHIESELLEPKRMKQLLTWCATRAMHPKPQGADFEESSARSAARVIEEELIKELSNRSQLSDWFSRAEAPIPAVPLPERPNPKNVLNAEKAAELEEKIAKLRSEKEALEALLRPPSIPSLQSSTDANGNPNSELLEHGDQQIVQTLTNDTGLRAEIGTRVNKVISSLGPAIDTFADGLHKVDQYRIGADQLAGQVLSICADKLSEREKIGKQKALGDEAEQSPGRNLNSILRGLSRADR